MIVILVLIWAVLAHFFWHTDWISLFVSGTGFLFWWYIIFSVIMGVFVLFVAILLPLLGLGAGVKIGKKHRLLFGSLGALAGGSLSLFVIAVFIVVRGCLIVGIYLLHNSLGADGNWDKQKLIIGGIIFLLGLIFSRATKFSSSSASSSRSLSTSRF